MRLIPYHTRLAWRSLRRDPGLSATIVIVLAVAACIFSTALIHWLRLYGPRPALSPGLHQVEIGVDDRTLAPGVRRLATPRPTELAPHTRVSFPNYQVLAASGIPARQMATFRSRLWIAPADGAPVATRCRVVRAACVAQRALRRRRVLHDVRAAPAMGIALVARGRGRRAPARGARAAT